MTATARQVHGSSRFRVVGRIGGGASGEVFEAIENESHARIAVKMLRDPSPDQIRLLKREFRAVQDIRHPNLVSLGELLEEAGQWFFTMELVEGIDFLQYVSRGRIRASVAPPTGVRPRDEDGGDHGVASGSALPFDEDRLRGGLAQLVSALRALHAAGKVHRDIKPSNVLVTRGGRVVLLDFGIIADRRGAEADDEDEVVGTPIYMAPEQAISSEVGPAADWYAVGVALYQALTGQPPFVGPITEVLTRKLSEVPTPPRELVAGVPADLDALCVSLLAIEPGDRPDGAAIAKALGVAEGDDAPLEANDVFVGRKRELAALNDAFETVRAGKSVVVFVEGESGVGKSVLVQRFTERMQQTVPGLLLLRGRCYERESVPYKAVDDAIDSLARALKRVPGEMIEALPSRALTVIGKSFPVLKAVTPPARSTGFFDVASPREQRARLFESMRALMRALAEQRPTVVTIDDLHWADNDSVALLTELLRAPGEPPMMVLCTLRSETILRARAQDIAREIAASAPDVRTIHVGKLPASDAEELTRALIQTRTDAGELSPESLRQILDETQGHPLFIDELIRRRRAGDDDEAGVHLDDVLWRRIRALDATARRLVELVAVAGVPVPQELVARAAAVDRAQLSGVLATLQHARFVNTTGDREGGLVSPYHDRVRESVVAHLDEDAVVAAHGHLALAAELGDAPDPEFLFAHWDGAKNATRAAEYARAAGDRAAQALAFDRAAHLYTRSLELGAPDAAGRREVQAKLADALTAAGREAEAADVRLDLARTAPKTEALDLRRQAAEQLLISGHFDRGRALLAEVLATVRERFPRSPIAVIFWLIVVRVTLLVRGVRFAEHDPSKLPKEALVRIDALWSAGAGFAMTDNIRGAYFQTKNLLLAMKVGDVRRAARALAMEVCFRSTAGTKGAKRTLALLDEARSLAERVGSPDALALADTAEGYAYYFLADWKRSIDAFDRAEAMFRDRCVGVHWQISSTRTMLYRALAMAGRLEDLRQRYGAVLRDAEQRGDRFAVLNLQCSAAFNVALADDRGDDAERLLVDATDALPAGAFLVQHYYHFLSYVQLDLYRGRAREAHDRMLAMLPTIRRSLLARVKSFGAQTEDGLARSALACAEADVAGRATWVAEARAAVEKLAAITVPWTGPVATLHRAAIRALEGDRDGAIATLREAITQLDASDLGLFATAARRRLAALVGGDEGSALAAQAAAFEKAQGIVRGDAFARLHAPGFGALG